MNPLVESCIEISRAGYEKRDEVKLQYTSKRLISIGNYILNNSNLDREFHLKQEHSSVNDNDVAICFGGGIDSYEAMFLALKNKRKVHLLYVNYGQPYFDKESQVFKDVSLAQLNIRKRGDYVETIYGKGCRAFWGDLNYLETRYGIDIREQLLTYSIKRIRLVKDGEQKDARWRDYIFPGRNLVLAAIASAYASTIWIVANKRSDEAVGTPDKTSRFYRESTSLFTDFYGRKVVVESPFINLSKLEATQQFIQAGGSVEALRNTFSCYGPIGNKHCGTCYSCFKRYRLFQALNVEHSFASAPWTGPNWNEFKAQEEKKGR